MRLTPMDVQRQSFPARFRGFDPEEVRQFLTLVAEELADLQRAHDLLEQEVQSLRSLVDEHRQREDYPEEHPAHGAACLRGDQGDQPEAGRSRRQGSRAQGGSAARVGADTGFGARARHPGPAQSAPVPARRHSKPDRAAQSRAGSRARGRAGPEPAFPQANRVLQLMAPASRPEAAETAARSVDGAVQLAVRVIPRASRNAIVGVRRGALCVRLQAPPVEGAANRALLRFLGKRLGVPPRAVSLVRGDTGARQAAAHRRGRARGCRTARRPALSRGRPLAPDRESRNGGSPCRRACRADRRATRR